jgi:hypothetical protein
MNVGILVVDDGPTPPICFKGRLWGHEERFPPPRLSAGYGFRKETIAGMRRNGREAPKPAVRLTK